MSDLDFVIAAEINKDAFYEAIVQIAAQQPAKHILEIGSSCGGGSTAAFVEGIQRNPSKPQLHCMELSKPRFEELKNAHRTFDFVKCYNYSSVPVEAFPSPQDVSTFYKRHKTNLNNTDLPEVLRWLQQDIDYIRQHDAVPNGIERVRTELGIEIFDVVLIDGSEFTGNAEFSMVDGAGWILLDDTNTYKNFENRRRLLKDRRYQLVEDNQKLRNGYAIFRRRPENAVSRGFWFGGG